MLLILFIFLLSGELASSCKKTTPNPKGCVCPKIIAATDPIRDSLVGNLTIEERVDSSGCSAMRLTCNCPAGEVSPTWIEGNYTAYFAHGCGYAEASTSPDFPIKCINGQWIDTNANEPTIIYCECFKEDDIDDLRKCREWVDQINSFLLGRK